MIFIVSGATGGHVYPGIAIAEALNHPSVFYVPREHPVQEIMAPYAFNYSVVPKQVRHWMAFPAVFIWVVWQFMKHRPTLVLAMGGQLCVAFAWIAWVCRVPVVGFEQNVEPGVAIRWIQPIATNIITSFPETNQLLAGNNSLCLGNPLRSYSGGFPVENRSIQALSGPTILIIGGSQGATAINNMVKRCMDAVLLLGVNMIHLTGTVHANLFKEHVNNRTQAQYIPLGYCNNMAALYEKATGVICRAGATTLAELKDTALPALLIPFPYAKNNHQLSNALAYQSKATNARVIEQSKLTTDDIIRFIETCTHPVKGPKKKSKTTKDICDKLRTYLN